MSKKGMSPLELFVDEISATAPWWVLFIIAFLMYLLFSYISSIEMPGGIAGLSKNPFLIVVLFSHALKIIIPAVFAIAGIASAAKQLSSGRKD